MVGRPRSRGSSVVDGGAPQCAPYAAMMVLTVRRGMVARPDHRYPSEDRSSSPLRRKATRILKTTRATASEASAVSLSAFAATYAAPATSTTSGIASRAKTNSSVTWTALWISPSFTVLGVFQAERSASGNASARSASAIPLNIATRSSWPGRITVHARTTTSPLSASRPSDMTIVPRSRPWPSVCTSSRNNCLIGAVESPFSRSSTVIIAFVSLSF